MIRVCNLKKVFGDNVDLDGINLEINKGEIVVALIDGDEATVKYFYREGYGFRFQPANDNYDPIYTNDAMILGKVIAVIRNYY